MIIKFSVIVALPKHIIFVLNNMINLVFFRLTIYINTQFSLLLFITIRSIFIISNHLALPIHL